MKLTEFLLVTAWCCTVITARAEAAANVHDLQQEALLKRAADQLDRLMPYRKMAEDRGETVDQANLVETWLTPQQIAGLDDQLTDGTKSDADQDVPLDLIEIDLPEQAESDSAGEKRANEDQGVFTIGLITDPQYAAMMQDRIKRGFNPGAINLLTTIAGGVFSGVASASASSAGKASTGSSHPVYKPVYGAPSTVDHSYTYGEKPFGPWDFKKAIFGTFFQALKAIGGGVLALKGQLVKGGGYLLAGKGKVFGKAGDAITSFGKHLAASAVTEQKPYLPEIYYGQPPIQPNFEHGIGYGPLPGHDGYSAANEYPQHDAYQAPSDNKDQGGLLIVTPTKSDLDGNDQKYTDVVVNKTPDLAALEESFGGEPAKGTGFTDFLSSIPKGIAQASTSGTKDQLIVNQNSNSNNNNLGSYSNIQHPAPVLGSLNHYTANHDSPVANYGHNYHADYLHEPHLAPQVALSHHHHFQDPGDPGLAFQPAADYPPLHLQQIQYPNLQGANVLANPPKLPHDDDDSIYASLSIDTEPNVESLKIPVRGSPSNAFDQPQLQAHLDFHKQPHFHPNHPYGGLNGPLRIPLLHPMPPSYYWQPQGPFLPTFDKLDHTRNTLHRRIFAKRFARHSPLQRHHRV